MIGEITEKEISLLAGMINEKILGQRLQAYTLTSLLMEIGKTESVVAFLRDHNFFVSADDIYPRLSELGKAVESLIKQGKANFDELKLGKIIEKLIKDGEVKICLPFSADGNRREIGIISTKRKLWVELYENMKKEFTKAGIN